MLTTKRTVVVALAIVGLLASACSSSGGGSDAAPTTAPPSSTTSTTAHAAPVPVPAKYRDLYDTLSTNLDAYQVAIDAMPAVKAGGPAPVLATELLPANGNRLEALLQPNTLAVVDVWLDQLQSLGFGGVTLGIKEPMLLPDLGPDSAAYRTFFAAVAEKVRARDMTLDVELGELFCGTVYAKCSYTYNGSRDDFVAATVAQARIVIDRVKPDNLTILAEPTTEATLAGVDAFNTVAGTAAFVRDVLAGIGDRRSTKVGAGAATWLDPSYNEAILREPVDYLALHIYPLNPRIMGNLVKDTALARDAGIPIVADEVGLYKTDGSESATPATADRIFRLDTFSFFEPLDARFAEITAEWAKKAGATYVSPYWAGQMFSYLDWTGELDALPYPKLAAAFNTKVAPALQAGKVSGLGQAWLHAL